MKDITTLKKNLIVNMERLINDYSQLLLLNEISIDDILVRVNLLIDSSACDLVYSGKSATEVTQIRTTAKKIKEVIETDIKRKSTILEKKSTYYHLGTNHVRHVIEQPQKQKYEKERLLLKQEVYTRINQLIDEYAQPLPYNESGYLNIMTNTLKELIRKTVDNIWEKTEEKEDE